MPEKNIEVLKLDKSIDNLYNEIESISHKSTIKILFIAGIENSFTEYIKPKSDGQSYFYQKTSVPRVLGYLNLEKERFRDNFDFCIIFLVRSFGLNYFIHRAPDFFDWRSGVFNCNQAEEEINLELERDIYEGLKVSTELLSQPLPQIINQRVVSYLNYREVNDAG
jgi:superkiller protein 3